MIKNTKHSILRGFTTFCVALSAAALSLPQANSQEAPKDKEISLVINNHLLKSKALAGRKLKVSSESGMVTLSGTLENLLSRDRAVALCRRVPGVFSVVDLTEVTPSDLTDAALANQVRQALANDPAVGGLDIAVYSGLDRVFLTGQVPNLGLQIRAMQITRGVPGLVRITDLTTVEDRKLNDEELSQSVSGICKNTELIDDNSTIEVEVENGKAVLTGEVANEFERTQARRLALRCGANKVDVQGLRIVTDGDATEIPSQPTRLTPEKIRDLVKRSLQSDPRVLSFPVDVEVAGGSVTLKGIVDHEIARTAAERAARFTAGVWFVDNLITLSFPETPPRDSTILKFANLAIQRDPYIPGENIILDCEESHLGLYGMVNTAAQKERAHFIASLQNGVVHVDNYLTVRKKWQGKSDEQISRDLKKRLSEVFINEEESDVSAKIKDGVALLEGAVESWALWQFAIDAANEAGARTSHCMIEVRYPDERGLAPASTKDYIPK